MKVTKCFRGVDMVRFGAIAKREIQLYQQEQNGFEEERQLYELDEPTPDELEWMADRQREKQEEAVSTTSRRIARQAVRKRHRAELMVPHLTDLNFVLYWPHCLHAHPELYERWDFNNIVMVGRELIDITDEVAADIFYEGDAPLNEASLHKLQSGPALALCLRLLNVQSTDFAALTRKILYEDVAVAPHDETKSIEGDLPLITAYDYYKTYSVSREEILQQRHEETNRMREELKEKRIRRLSEMRRLAFQAIEEAVLAKRTEREQHKLELLKSGNLEALQKLEDRPVDDEVDIVVPKELEDEEDCLSVEDDPDEYFPPPGLLIPGFYAPPNEIAKVNGLAMLFPKLVRERVIPQAECLPPHVLVMLEITKRQKALETITPYKNAVIHMGIFKATGPYDSVHIAYTVKQFETLDKVSWNLDDLKIAFMLSVERDVPLLQLVDLNPFYVSRDAFIGEEECAAMFPVDYSDDYDGFEDFANDGTS
ncbi:unnamed protein product [Arctia plantaginis]|uniref:DUF4746 domain-containing protein n=1 Tax=Arctia plantaginis TaxID=874455 RepID=A0A8S1B3C0_ARCPL|nr:unnamed protein product [Arctia plantaginis]